MQPPISETPAAEPRVYETPAGEQTAAADSGYVSVTHLWNVAEHRRWFRQNERHSRPRIVVNVVLVLMVLYDLLTIGTSVAVRGWSFGSTALAVLVVVLVWLRFSGLAFLSARLFAQQVPDARYPIHTVVSPYGLQVTTATASGEVAWAGLQKVVETDEFFLFFIADRNSRYLPKCALASPGDAARVRDLVRRYGPPQQILAG
jgi:hypothetical protein